MRLLSSVLSECLSIDGKIHEYIYIAYLRINALFLYFTDLITYLKGKKKSINKIFGSMLCDKLNDVHCSRTLLITSSPIDIQKHALSISPLYCCCNNEWFFNQTFITSKHKESRIRNQNQNQCYWLLFHAWQSSKYFSNIRPVEWPIV